MNECQLEFPIEVPLCKRTTDMSANSWQNGYKSITADCLRQVKILVKSAYCISVPVSDDTINSVLT